MMTTLTLDTEYENNPRRLISMAYIVSEGVETLYSRNMLVKHNFNIFQIDENGIAFSKHNITNQMCQDEGIPIKQILETFSNDLESVTSIIGHNIIAADLSTIRREAIGIGLWEEIWNKLIHKNIYDTLKESKKIFPDINSYSLDKVYKHIYNLDFHNHHNAIEDCKITLQIFNYIIENKENKLDVLKMNFPENNIKKKQKLCSHCDNTMKKYYIVTKKEYLENYGRYIFKPYSIKGIIIGESFCCKCYQNIEIVKYYQDEMIDILNNNLPKNSFKYKTEFLESKQKCFDFINSMNE